MAHARRSRTQSAPPSPAVAVGLAALSGLALGGAFPPADWKGLVWVGLAPLVIALRAASRPRDAFALGFLAGLCFFFQTLHPLVSAHSWTGWAVESTAAFHARMTRQWWFMQGIWAAFALWCALFWGIWAALTARLARTPVWGMVTAASLWILLPEALRGWATFGPTWAFLGNAAADLAPVRQWAALGGVWVLSASIVCANWVIAEAWPPQREGWWKAPLVLAALAAALSGAVQLADGAPAGRTLRAAALQTHQDEYVTDDFSTIGMDRNYFTMARQALAEGADLIVLPESISLGALSLDGSPSQVKPPEWQHAREAWDQQMTALLAGSRAALILGIDTVERQLDHNTLVAWTAQGSAGWYHKRRLVPFAEYRPQGWGGWAIRGRSQYVPGRGAQLIRAGDLILGGFICQEVLYPWVTRESVRDGAALLVSGGNDGVFGDPAVALAHADAAQLRAVETGRYVVRAMKTGISAVIDPTGRELTRSRSAEPVLLRESVQLRRTRTPYVRFGDWMLWLAGAVAAGAAWRRRRA